MLKNFRLALIAIVAMLLVTGCGSTKTLKCSGDLEGMKTELVANFDKKNKFSNADMTMVYKADEETLKAVSISDMNKLLKESMESEMGGAANVEVTDNGKDTITIKLQMNREQIEKTMKVDASDSYEDFKKSVETDGFTCK